MFWVALAGPASNFFLAIMAVLIFGLFKGPILASAGATTLIKIFQTFVVLNLFLAVFNLIPLHPLDGGKILGRFLPDSVNRFLEDNQTMIGLGFLAFYS